MNYKELKDLTNLQLQDYLKDLNERIKLTTELKENNTSVFDDNQVLNMDSKFHNIKDQVICEIECRRV